MRKGISKFEVVDRLHQIVAVIYEVGPKNNGDLVSELESKADAAVFGYILELDPYGRHPKTREFLDASGFKADRPPRRDRAARS